MKGCRAVLKGCDYTYQADEGYIPYIPWSSRAKLSKPARYTPAENAEPQAIATIQSSRAATLISLFGCALVANGSGGDLRKGRRGPYSTKGSASAGYH